MRRLLIVPIVHSQTDLGSLTEVVNATKEVALGGARAAATRRTIQQFWDDLQSVLLSMELPCDRLLVYQDGLPVIENQALQIEKQIVSELARGGSPNHRIVMGLLERGAGLVGTESPALLLKEYEAIRKSLAAGFRPSEQEVQGSDELKSETSQTELQASETTPPALSLLEQRDHFIAERIDKTLGEDQVGVLFIGLAHRVESILVDDIEVTYPVGRPSDQLACSAR